MKFNALVFVVLLGLMAYIGVNKYREAQAREEEQQAKQEEGAAAQLAPAQTPAPKPGDTSWMWQRSSNPLERGAYHRN